MRLGVVVWLIAAGCTASSAASPPSALPSNHASEADVAEAIEAAGGSYAAVAGTWKGIGLQDTGSTWTIDMTLYPDAEVDEVIGTIVYASTRCSAVLVRLADETDDAYVMRERLTTGLDLCVNDGFLRVRELSDETLDWRWTYSDGSHGATATVRRVE